MIKAIWNIIIGACFMCPALTSAQYVRFTPEFTRPGDSVTLFYNPTNTPLQGLAPVQGRMYTFANNEWQARDLTMQMVDSGWVTKFYLPEGSAFSVFNFEANGIVDKGGKMTYATMHTAKDGRIMAQGYTTWGFLRSPMFRSEMPPVVDSSAMIAKEVTMMWLKNEILHHPESRRPLYPYAIRVVREVRGKDGDSIILRENKFILSQPDATEQELIQVRDAYQSMLGDKQHADSVDQLIAARFPNGIAARDIMIKKLFLAKPEQRDVLWQEFTQRFPLGKLSNTETEKMYYGKVYRGRVYEAVGKTKNLSILDSMMAPAPFVALTEFHRLLIMNAWEHDQVGFDEALEYSGKLVKYIEAYTTKREGENSNFYTPLQWKQYILSLSVPAFKGHAVLLHKAGKDQEALTWLEKVKDQPDAKRADFLDIYAQVLMKNNRQRDAQDVAEAAARNNKATPATIEILKSAYVKKHGNDKGFDSYFESMKNTDDLNKEREALKAQLIRRDAPEFRLEQMSGGEAILSRLKGKIVVLDFWATWCGPCKEALPGMQMVVNKYKNDKDVQFYFIATQETKPDYKQAIKEFMQSKGYHLSVLFDAKDKNTGKLDATYNKYVKAMGFSGIPAKFIIDQHGVIRWMGSGYKGSPSGLADEISYIVELLKKEG
ncbi:Thiol-disulfide isomerase or thioredoxin [Chitinophaga terrae (ex Kim and Jung 2007)]|uniref:Thiol-disulfide isomerase or thioredoxin n=1 Tax=Chitinophaga terrae (ex Kim and Jung 2007) TaxID=408074 RepID=A0A1H4AWI0_9BACT|nr:TlpA disulfide reductase family protein [Chitinophaga terrae (ex Kim and Jung 2007)]GEP89114.1 hypothetical protein CTE07_07590 [Chitinophaga terrae (ex Kim and Jung 2007)]SEA40002.1 Thiol-disulfide isomerase or thioredoxin [Chitinophaga terrae (ex Kim and Jung 2007)]